jgi:hypothetical protein
MLDTQILEKILITNWTSFLDFRKCLDYAGECAFRHGDISNPCRAEKLTISRFEFTKNGFLLWLDYSVDSKEFTTEAILCHDGSFIHIKTI